MPHAPFGKAVLCTFCGNWAEPHEIKEHKCPKCGKEYTKEEAKPEKKKAGK